MKLIYVILLVPLAAMHAQGDSFHCYVCDGDECNNNATIRIENCGSPETTTTPDITTTTETITEETETTSGDIETTADATETTPSATETTADATETTSGATETTPGATETTTDATDTTLGNTEITPGVTETTSVTTDTTESTSTKPAETTPSATETTTRGAETTPDQTGTTEIIPVSTEITPVATEATSDATEATASATETTPAITDTTSDNTDTVPGATETIPVVTDTTELSAIIPAEATTELSQAPTVSNAKINFRLKRSISASTVLINNYRRISRTRRDSSEISNSCYSVEYIDGDEIKKQKGCVAIPTEKSACEIIAEKVGTVVENSCKPCVGELCNSSSMLKLSVLTLLVAIFVKILL